MDEDDEKYGYTWVRTSNADVVDQSEAVYYRCVAKLDRKYSCALTEYGLILSPLKARMITCADIKPKETWHSPSSSSSTSLTPPIITSTPDGSLNERPKELGPSLIATHKSDETRDGTDVCYGSSIGHGASHLMDRSNAAWVRLPQCPGLHPCSPPPYQSID